MTQAILKDLEARKARSKWAQGVKIYAMELLEELQYQGLEPTEENMLNGAKSWRHYSWGGNSLINDLDIAERLATPSELKQTDGGEKRPNSTEEWLDVQARALVQACKIIKELSERK